MPALNFQARFSGPVLLGTKRSTIRLPRKDGRNPKPGQTLYLFTGMRTKQCRRLLETTCERVSPIRITIHGCIIWGGKPLKLMEAARIAEKEGFDCLAAMLDWFRKTHGLPFTGLLIEW